MHRIIPLTVPASELNAAAEHFLRFLENVPEEAKRRVHFKSTFHRGSADGYCDVRGILGKDPKEYFHFSPRLLNEAAYQDVKNEYADARTFFEAAEHIYEQVERMAEQVMREDLSDYYDRCFDKDGKLYAGQLRFLCYTPGAEAFRAKAHYDKGVAAIALAESSGGLRVGCCANHPLIEVNRSPAEAVFMPAQLIWEMSSETIIPTWHDVVPDPTIPPVSERCARWAIVLFINDKDGKFPEWDATHTPLPVHSAQAT